MLEAIVVFTLDGSNVTIQCSQEEKMRDICQRFGNKVESNVNSLIFLYNGQQLNFELKFKEQANTLDKENKEMKVLVYKSENDLRCPKCGERISIKSEKIDELISSNNNIRVSVTGIKIQIDNIINNTQDLINIQLKNIIVLLNNIIEDIKKNTIKLNNLLLENNTDNNIHNNTINNNIINNNTINNNNKNIIRGKLEIILNEVNDNIILFNSEINSGIDCYLNDQKINMIKEDIKYKLNYKFQNEGKYSFEIQFNENITTMEKFFQECSNIISLDFTNFDTSNITNMYRMFHGCKKLKEINGLNKFITRAVTNMSAFVECLVRSNFQKFDDLKAIETELKRAASIMNDVFNLKGEYTFSIQDLDTGSYSIYSDSDNCDIYRIYLRKDYWHLVSGYVYSQLFSQELWLRKSFVKAAKALGQNEAWYCDEYHLDNCESPNWNYDTQSFKEWLSFAESVSGTIPEFPVDGILSFCSDKYSYMPIYHDSF